MPRSRFVPASRLRPIVVYCAIAFVVLLVADIALQSLGWGGRHLLVVGWMIAFPLGGVWVWRRG